jgi:phosphatidylinositol glycan class F
MHLSIGLCYLQLIGLTYVISILMGAPLFTDVMRTFFFSIYLVFIGFTPIIISSKGNLKDIYDFVFQNETIFNPKKRFLMRNLVWGTMIGAWLGVIPIPLDWDRWWQRWPITCLVSSTIGAGLSILISYLWLWTRQRRKIND